MQPTASPQPAPQSPALSISADRAINFASQQNAIPVVKELRVSNNSIPRAGLELHIRTEPAFAEPISLRLESLAAGETFRVAPLDLRLKPDFLANLNEKVAGLLHIELRAGELLLASRSEPLSLMARNEWCGLVSLPEILAAFVLPNDPAILATLSHASELLARHTGRSALNGYQDKNRAHAWDQVAAIYQAVAALQLRYISPPASFENSGQKVRFPSEVLSQRFGTCLDLCLFFAACCEQAGLHPLILIHEGHSYAGCWLEERSLEDPAIDDLQRVRKLVELESLTVFETTLVTASSPGTLADAEQVARPHLSTEKPFRLALDIHRARGARVLPLPIGGQAPDDRLPPCASSASTEAGASGLGSRSFDATPALPDAAPTEPATRIDQWKSRLLDLSLRNHLLNFKPVKKNIPVCCNTAEHVEDELAANVVLALHPRPALMGKSDPRDPFLFAQQNKSDALTEHLHAELHQGRLHSGLEEPEHTRRLTELYRAARVSLDENGTNTLYIAVGLLEWRETEQSDRVLRAPLLLVPVELRRKSVVEGFTLRRLDEETRLNVTLMEMLRREFQKELPGLDPLPEDDAGVNVTEVFRIFRESVRDMPGWELKPELWLGLFSFTKFLLWKDLSDRLDLLTRNRVVDHLVNGAGTAFPPPAQAILPGQLDDLVHPRNVFCPRSADSSQLAAVVAAAEGHDFVLEGPPGTGKSQTITNIIAQCLANGKRVLFVAEKRAALDVVHRRLCEEGLGPFCLELHSNKTGKSEVLAQFEESLKFLSESQAADWAQRADELDALRGALNGYARTLHRRHPCGLSVFACFDYLLPRKDQPVARLDDWTSLADTPAAALDEARGLAAQLRERTRPLGALADHPMKAFACTDWSPAWAERLLDQLRALESSAKSLHEATRDLRAWLQLPDTPLSQTQLQQFCGLLASLGAPEAVGPSFTTTPWSQLALCLDAWTGLAAERTALRAQLAGYDEARLLAQDLAGLYQRWQAAQTAWAPVKWVQLDGLRRQLALARTDAAMPQAETLGAVLAAALRLRDIRSALAAAAPLAQASLGALWANGEPQEASLRRVRGWGDNLHTRLSAFAGDNLNLLAQLRQRLALLFAEGSAALAPQSPLGQRLARHRAAVEAFMKAFTPCAAELRLRPEALAAGGDYLEQIATLAARSAAIWPQLRLWCSWQQLRDKALRLGLEPLITLLETDDALADDLPGLFERSFRRAFLFALIEREPRLRGFIGSQHATLIEQFSQLDERLASLTREVLGARLAAGLPGNLQRDDPLAAELGLLRKEIGKKTRHIPVRQLLSRLPQLLPRLKPCVLMSPLSVAQYLEASHEPFDLVVFDEASQIPVWDAVGAIARGAQLIVVGDPKQLPPTNFFNRSDEGEEELDPEFEDLESILDELLTQGLHHKRLQWHYRSRHESLITFSNRQYYDNELLTFPSSTTNGGGVRFHHLPEARYEKGGSRTNPLEARALVAELLRRLRDPKAPRRSYGVVTFSMAQQLLVETLLDAERRKDPALEVHFGDESPVEGEEVFVKNLESVQGDERDVILFSICYGPDEKGVVSMNFGPLNREGGERRLNVAITRAKHEVLVFSGLRGDQIDLARSRARGVGDLKYFLDYAERGPSALAAAAPAQVKAAAASEFTTLVAECIRNSGYEARCQVGCSGYRLDIGVLDPANPGRFLLGVECDGPSYQAAATARDRDKLRRSVLEGLGWKLHRVWSPEWWHDPESEKQRLLAALKAAQS